MTAALNRYLEAVRDNLRIETSARREFVQELETHLEDSIQDLKQTGLSEEDATSTCLQRMGPATTIARQIYEAHAQGSWRQALLACMPHLLFALLFTLNWWHHLGWLALTLALVISATVYGWWHGKPTWLFSWLGYSLIPVATVGMALPYLPREWSLVTIPLYFLLALWWLFFLVMQCARRDWLLNSVMLLPAPVIAGWVLTLIPEAGLTEQTLGRVYFFAPWVGLSFFILALTIVAFIRLRQRWLRIGLLIISGLFTLTVVAYYAGGRLTLPAFLGLVLVTWGLFLVPPLLERWLRKGRGILKQRTSLGARLKS